MPDTQVFEDESLEVGTWCTRVGWWKTMKVKGLAIDDDLFYVSHDKVAFLVFNEYQLTVSQRRHILCYDGGLPCYVYVLEDIL